MKNDGQFSVQLNNRTNVFPWGNYGTSQHADVFHGARFNLVTWTIKKMCTQGLDLIRLIILLLVRDILK